jgi:hypothetical protein
VGRGADVSVEFMGMERVKEALEANNWAGGDGDDLDLDGLDDEDDDGSIGFGMEAAELMGEMFDMKRAIYGDDYEGDEAKEGEGEEEEEKSVEQLEAMMLRLQAVKGEF